MNQLDQLNPIDNLLSDLEMIVVYKKQRTPVRGSYVMQFEITIIRNGKALKTDYTMGIGHLPEYGNKKAYDPKTLHGDKMIASALKTGILYLYDTNKKRYDLSDIPRLRDVFHSLLMDADSAKEISFKEWANEFDYSTDSRKALQQYESCRAIGAELRKLYSKIELAQLLEAYQNY